MIRYLLDTNVISEVRKLKPHGAVLEWLRGLLPEQIFVSAVTLGELQVGIERARRCTIHSRRTSVMSDK